MKAAAVFSADRRDQFIRRAQEVNWKEATQKKIDNSIVKEPVNHVSDISETEGNDDIESNSDDNDIDQSSNNYMSSNNMYNNNSSSINHHICSSSDGNNNSGSTYNSDTGNITSDIESIADDQIQPLPIHQQRFKGDTGKQIGMSNKLIVVTKDDDLDYEVGDDNSFSD
jgi:hypothetical protein